MYCFCTTNGWRSHLSTECTGGGFLNTIENRGDEYGISIVSIIDEYEIWIHSMLVDAHLGVLPHRTELIDDLSLCFA